jgi:beta-lactamase regulating signal transducer with metallopeptidase domain
MQVLIAIALKSLLIAGLTLGLLALMKRRSAAERSWIAHIGLLALVIMALAPLVLPSWNVEAPALLGQAPVTESTVQTPTPPAAHEAAPLTLQNVPNVAAAPSVSPVAVATALYAVPAVILLFVTLLALARLIALRARADVLVDGHWLSALARAQRRMGFKHGTALLTSNDLASPISWGLMRPVILLNTRAVEASGEAEAIIAHELAHVARMDWVKLLLARVATALFWFNPLVWLLAREAHQLREEAADDAVLAADIPDTDYAELLVGVARHECPGLLLGAHGVAPSKSSLARRVARVLDGASVRGPVARSFALGVFVGAMLIAAPLAALTLTPGGASKQDQLAQRGSSPLASAGSSDAVVPVDLPHILAKGVSTSVSTAFAAVAPVEPDAVRTAGSTVAVTANGDAVIRAADGRTIALSSAAAVPPAPPAPPRPQRSAIDRAIAIKAVGATPEYVAAIRAAAPQLRLDDEDIVQLKGVGVTAEFVQELARLGYRAVDADEIAGAYAAGVRSDYVRALAAAGYGRLSLNQLTELKAVGVTAADVERFRRAGFSRIDVDKLVQLKTLGITPEELRASERYGP